MKLLKKILTLSLALIFVFSMSSYAYAEKDNRIKAYGSSTITLKPDMAVISFTTETTEKSQTVSLAKNSEKMNKILKEFKKFGIKEKDISTQGFRVYPVYNYDEGEKLQGYKVSNNINITVRNLNDIGKLLDLGIKSGADQVGDITYSSTKMEETYNKALELAAKNGKKKAESTLKGIGKKVKEVVYIEEVRDGYYGGYGEIAAETADMAKETPITIKDLLVEVTVLVECTF